MLQIVHSPTVPRSLSGFVALGHSKQVWSCLQRRIAKRVRQVVAVRLFCNALRWVWAANVHDECCLLQLLKTRPVTRLSDYRKPSDAKCWVSRLQQFITTMYQSSSCSSSRAANPIIPSSWVLQGERIMMYCVSAVSACCVWSLCDLISVKYRLRDGRKLMLTWRGESSAWLCKSNCNE